MSPKERILAVYQNQTPDQIPFMLDLSHWFYHKNRMPWDISQSYNKPEYALIDYHRKMDVGFYMPNLALFFEIRYPDDVQVMTQKSNDGKTITWTVNTPLGSINRIRVWDDITYSWGIKKWGVRDENQLKILCYALENRSFKFNHDNYQAWVDYIADAGVCYVPAGYSGMGQLLNYWMGIEGTMYATMDYLGTLKQVIDKINQNNLNFIDMLCESPAQIILMGDNFSSDIQPRSFYSQWSKSFYDEAIKRLHRVGKYVAVHIDGKLSGAIEMIQDSGADCADAVTPKPMGDLTAQQCRNAAGKNFILSGGVSPDLWLPEVPLEEFKKAVLDWLRLKDQSSRLIANAGDQVPPGADEDRIKIMRDLINHHGTY